MEHEPIFFIGPNGPCQIEASWRTTVAEFCAGVRVAVGNNAVWHLRPYRLGRTAYLAFDIKGSAGEVNVTLIESEVNKLPNAATIFRTREIECELTDIVDCYYLVESVLESLETSLPSGLSSVLAGPKTITR